MAAIARPAVTALTTATAAMLAIAGLFASPLCAAADRAAGRAPERAATMPVDDTRVQLITCPTSEDSQAVRLAESFAAPGQERLAPQMNYYRAGPIGVFAPKGWSCHAWLGSGGNLLLVTPRPLPPPFYPLPSVNGPAVLMQVTDNSASGRFHVAITAARLFPLLGQDLVAKVRSEHLISDSSFDVQPYPDDRMQYLSDRLIAYTTPARRSGLGTDSLLETDELPIRGVTSFSSSGELRILSELRVRLPESQRPVGDAVLDLEIRCFQLQQGCRALTD